MAEQKQAGSENVSESSEARQQVVPPCVVEVWILSALANF